jgi:acetyl esterase
MLRSGHSNADFGENLQSPNTHDRLLRDLVRETGYAFVFPYYTPAPDAHYPTQIEESYAVLEWIAANGASKGLKTDKFAIAGDSVGG